MDHDPASLGAVPTPAAGPPDPPPSTRAVGPGGSGSRSGIWIGVALLIGAIAIANVFSRVGTLEATGVPGGQLSDDAVSAPAPAALPVDVPPPDAEVARRSIVESWTTVFTTADPSERVAALTDAGDLAERFAAFGGGPCVATSIYVTDIRFTGNDTAYVRFRFTGGGVPAGGEQLGFDGSARRVGDRWLVEPSGVVAVLDAAEPYCAVTTTTSG